MVLWGIMKKLKLTYKQEVNGEENQRKDWENWEILRFQENTVKYSKGVLS